MAPPHTTLVRGLALTAGLTVALLALLSWRVPASQRELGADVRVDAAPRAELGLGGFDDVLSASGLQPGGPAARGATTVSNQAGRPLRVGVRLDAADAELSRLLHLELRLGGRLLARGALGALRRTSTGRAELAPGERRRLELRAWLPADRGEDFRARLAEARVIFDTAGSRR
jgi:hypothetical protein